MKNDNQWLANLEFELEYRLRQIIREHGGPIATDHPKVRRLFRNLAGIRKAKEAAYDRAPTFASIASLKDRKEKKR